MLLPLKRISQKRCLWRWIAVGLSQFLAYQRSWMAKSGGRTECLAQLHRGRQMYVKKSIFL